MKIVGIDSCHTRGAELHPSGSHNICGDDNDLERSGNRGSSTFCVPCRGLCHMVGGRARARFGHGSLRTLLEDYDH